jgi:DNA-binding MarR family transcriptional regulator
VDNRKIKQLDTASGELLDGCLVYVPRKTKFRTGWFMMFQDVLLELSKDREITGEVYRVLLYLLSKMDFENHIEATQGEAAAELGLQKTNVSRAVKTLCAKGILLKGDKAGRSTHYRFNSHYGWKGKVKNFETERRRRFEALQGGRYQAPGAPQQEDAAANPPAAPDDPGNMQ